MASDIIPSSTTVQLAIVAFTFLYIGIGAFFARRQGSMKDFYIAGQRIPPYVVGFSIAAAVMSGWGYVGGPGAMYAGGMSTLPIIEVMVLGGYVLSFFLLARPLRQLASEHGAVTIPDLGEILYDSKLLRVLLAVGVIAGVIGYLSAQYLAITTIIESIFGIGHLETIFLSAAVITIYSTLGAKESAMWTDFIQGVIMVLATFLAIGWVFSVGGFGEIFTTLSTSPEVGDPNFTAIFKGTPSVTFLSYALLFGLGIMGLPHMTTKFYTIRKKNMLKWALPTLLIVYSMMFLFEFMGMATRYGVVELGWPALENPDQASSLFITQVFPPVVQGILFAAIVAAILSTADSFLIVGSSAFSRDIYQKYIFPKYLGGKEKYAFDEVWLARGMTFVLGFVPALIIINPPTIIMWLGALGWGIFAASLMSVVVFGLHWNHANRYGAIGAVVVGLIVSVGGGILNVGYDVDLVLHPGAWGVVLSVITMIVLSKATPSPTTTRNAAVSDD